MRTTLAILILGLAMASWAQSPGPGPAEVLRAESRILTLRDLPAHYRALSVGGDLQVAMTAGVVPGNSGAYISALSAVWVDPDEWTAFLDGRLPRIRVLAVEVDHLSAAALGEEPESAPLFTERWIEHGGVNAWTPIPSASRELLRQAMEPFRRRREFAGRTQALSQVKRIATALMLLSGDLDERYPRVNSTAEVQIAARPYLKDESAWTTPNPKGGRILFNVALSGLNVESLSDPQNVLMVWEEHPWSDGTRAVGFADGHVRRVAEAKWTEIWTAELARRARGRVRSHVKSRPGRQP